jgi:hypothetical protein
MGETATESILGGYGPQWVIKIPLSLNVRIHLYGWRPSLPYLYGNMEGTCVSVAEASR